MQPMKPKNYMPLALDLAHSILRENFLRLEEKVQRLFIFVLMLNLRVTIEYSDDHKPQRIDAIVVSTQHDDFAEDEEMLAKLEKIL